MKITRVFEDVVYFVRLDNGYEYMRTTRGEWYLALGENFEREKYDNIELEKLFKKAKREQNQ